MSSIKLLEIASEIQEGIEAAERVLPGLTDFTAVSLSGVVMPSIAEAIVKFERRLELCQAAISALDALNADGFPDEILVEMSDDGWEEFQGQRADEEAASRVFVRKLPASSGTINLGTPVARST